MKNTNSVARQLKTGSALIVLSICLALGINELFLLLDLISVDVSTAYTKLNLAIAVIVAPVLEELIFRFLVYKIILFGGSKLVIKLINGAAKPIDAKTLRIVNIGAIVLSSVMFGVYHLNLWQGIYATFMGMVFCYCYYKFGKLDYSYIMHMSANIITIVIPLYLPILVTNKLLNTITLCVTLGIAFVIMFKYFANITKQACVDIQETRL